MSINKYLQFEATNYHSVLFPLFLYFVFSSLRGIIFTLSTYFFNILALPMVILMMFSPLLFLIVPNSIHKFWLNSVFVAIISWGLTIFISDVTIKFILMAITLGLSLGIVRLYLMNQNTIGKIGKDVIFSFIMIDLIARVANQGIDPSIHTYLIPKIALTILLILLLIVIYFNSSTINQEYENLEKSELRANPYLVFILFQLLFIYLIYFANFGIISTILNVQDPYGELVYTFMLLIVLLILRYSDINSKLAMSTIIRYGMYLSLIILGIVLYPWNNQLFIMVIAFAAFVLLFEFVIGDLDFTQRRELPFIAISINLAMVFNLITVLQLALNENKLFHMLFAVYLLIPVIINLYLKRTGGKNNE